MRPALILQCLLVFSLLTAANAFGLDLIIGAVTGLAKGMLTGMTGAFGPMAKDGLNAMLGMFGGGSSGMGGLLGKKLAVSPGVSHPASAMGSAANQAMGSAGGLGSMVTSMVTSWMNLLQQFASGAGSAATSLFNMFKSALENFFSKFGSLQAETQKHIGTMYVETAKKFNAVMYEKLHPAKHEHLIMQELTAAKKVMETKYDHSEQLFAALNHHAPHLSKTVKAAHQEASAVFHKHQKELKPEGKEELKIMHENMKMGLLGMLGPLSSMMGGMMGGGASASSGMFSMVINILKNILSMAMGLV